MNDKLFKPKSPFTWGLPIKYYHVGPYTVLMFHTWQRKGSSVLTGLADLNKIEYHGWIDGKDTSTSWTTLDEALAGLIAYRHDGPNCRAGDYFIRSLQEVTK